MRTEVVDSIIRSNPILSHGEQLDLVKAWKSQSCKDSLDKLILSNMRIVSKEAFSIKKKNPMMPYEDLIQEGMAGLLKAADMFDEEQEVNFLTYAMLWVKANMRSYVLSYKSVVKMGTTRDDRVLFSNLSKALTEADSLGLVGDGKTDFVAKTLGVNRDSVSQMIISIKSGDSRLDAPVKNSDGNETLRINLIADEDSGESEFVNRISSSGKESILESLVSGLPEDEQKIIRDRYLTEDPKTLRDLEKEMSISREWIRKLEIKALDRIKKRLNSNYGISNILDI
jgi:RNA polymerase sigma-32 factor